MSKGTGGSGGSHGVGGAAGRSARQPEEGTTHTGGISALSKGDAPSGEDKAAMKAADATAKSSVASLSAADRKVVQEYAIGDFTGIRAANTMSAKELEKKYGAKEAARYTKMAKHLDGALNKASATPGTVFRGVHNLSAAQVNEMISGKSITMSSPTSTSRSADIARGFASAGRKGTYSVMLKIRHRTGVNVDHINPGKEHETLLKRGTKLNITKRYVDRKNSKLIVIEAVEA